MQKMITKWPLLILIGNIGIFFAYTSYFSFNFPLQDDVMVIDFIVKKEHLSSDFHSWYVTLFGLANDHSLMIPRLSVWLIQLVNQGAINFNWIIQYNLFILITFFFIISIQYRKNKLPLIYLLPISFILFQPHFHEVTNWPLTGLQQVHLFLFLAIAVHWLENKKNILIPLLCAFLAGFSIGNGIAIFILIGIYLYSENRIKQVLGVIGATIIYVLSLLPVFDLSEQAKFNLNILNTIKFTLGVLGSIALEFTKGNDDYAIMLGILIGGMMSFFIFQKWIKKNTNINQFFFYIGIFVLGATLIIALPRGSMDWKVYHSSRFFIYSEIIIICIYSILLFSSNEANRKIVFMVGLIFACVFSLLSFYFNTETLIDRKNLLRADHDNWNRNKSVICEIPQVFQNIKPILNNAYKNQWIKQEKFLISDDELQKLDKHSKPNFNHIPILISNHADTIMGKSNFWVNRFSFIHFDKLDIENPISKSFFLVIQNEKTKKCFLSPLSFKRGAIRDFIFKPGSNYLSKSGIAMVHTEYLDTGNYKMFLLMEENGRENIFYKISKRLMINPTNKSASIFK